MDNSWQGKSIVVVDDSEDARAILEKIYGEVGLVVAASLSSGLEALEVVPKLLPEYVSLDIIMPEMDGIECYGKLRDLQLASQVFFVSAFSTEPRVIEGFKNEIPPETFLSKPLQKEVLLEYLRRP